VLVVLYRGDMFMTEKRTDDDGRARLGDDLDPGTYRLVFHPPSPFFKRVELEVALGPGHFHVPLLVSPYGCASYRGS
jgi:5-hydroxyisourate hydrolase